MFRFNGTVPPLSRFRLTDASQAWARAKGPAMLPGCVALAGIGVSTWLSFRSGQGFAFTGFLYLILVVLCALYGGFYQATLVSVAATACLDYFFVPPIFSFVNSPANWVALGAFELTALVISRLSLRARMQAAEAMARERDMERLYETSRRILLIDNHGEPGDRIVALIRQVFDLQAVQLFDAMQVTTYKDGETPAGSEQHSRDAYFLDADWFDAGTRSWYCVLRLGTRPVGGLALHGTSMNQTAATALSSLCGIAIERLRALQRESNAQVARRTEQLRTAVLDALAHQFKTPLAIARTASSGLLVIGGLSELQTDLVTSIDEQVRLLDRLASRLLTAERLEGAEVKPQRQPLVLSELTTLAIRQVSPESERMRFQVSVPEQEVAVLADRELILTSVAQLIQNAVQYSEPGSPIDVSFEFRNGGMVLSVRNKGLVVAPNEREQIFERFYRAPGARHLPTGTGLGLSIVKKIVEAHQGNVWAEGVQNYGTSFSIALPAAPAG